MGADLRSIGMMVRDVRFAVLFSLSNNHRATQGSLFQTAEAASGALRELVAGGMTSATTASRTVDDGVSLLWNLNHTRALPDDPVVRATVANAKTTWKAAVAAMDELVAANPGR